MERRTVPPGHLSDLASRELGVQADGHRSRVGVGQTGQRNARSSIDDGRRGSAFTAIAISSGLCASAIGGNVVSSAIGGYVVSSIPSAASSAIGGNAVSSSPRVVSSAIDGNVVSSSPRAASTAVSRAIGLIGLATRGIIRAHVWPHV